MEVNKINVKNIKKKALLKIISNKIEELKSTGTRLNTRTLEMKDVYKPLNLENGIEWTEDFDGIIYIKEKKLYINFKFICGSGGAQTRTIREVYHFIVTQYKYVKKNYNNKIFFANIIDGDQGYKFIYENKEKKKSSLLDLSKYYPDNIQKYIYIGDLYNFKKWYDEISK